jgi:hypothetical protein
MAALPLYEFRNGSTVIVGFAKNLFRLTKRNCHSERSEASRFRFFGRFAPSE